MRLLNRMEPHGLQLFNVPAQSWRHIEYPDTVKTLSLLPNGTVAANFVGSGLQLLDLIKEYTASQQLSTLTLTVHLFDEDRIIGILPTPHDCITLLEPATISQLMTIPVHNTHTIPTDHIAIACASLANRMAVHYFNEREKEYMQLWKPNNEHPSWTVEIDEAPLTGSISPSGTSGKHGLRYTRLQSP